MNKASAFIRRNSKIVLFGIFVLVCVLVLVLAFYDTITELWPGDAKIEQNLANLKSRQKELQKELNELNALRTKRASYVDNSKIFWIARRDGDAETNAQRIIEDAASSAGLVLSTIGRVQSQTITEGVASMEISIQASSDIDKISSFIEQIYKKNPRFYWGSLSLSPDNVRNPQKVVMSGTLRFISVSDDDIVKKLLGEKNESKE